MAPEPTLMGLEAMELLDGRVTMSCSFDYEVPPFTPASLGWDNAAFPVAFPLAPLGLTFGQEQEQVLVPEGCDYATDLRKVLAQTRLL